MGQMYHSFNDECVLLLPDSSVTRNRKSLKGCVSRPRDCTGLPHVDMYPPAGNTMLPQGDL